MADKTIGKSELHSLKKQMSLLFSIYKIKNRKGGNIRIVALPLSSVFLKGITCILDVNGYLFTKPFALLCYYSLLSTDAFVSPNEALVNIYLLSTKHQNCGHFSLYHCLQEYPCVLPLMASRL